MEIKLFFCMVLVLVLALVVGLIALKAMNYGYQLKAKILDFFEISLEPLPSKPNVISSKTKKAAHAAFSISTEAEPIRTASSASRRRSRPCHL